MLFQNKTAFFKKLLLSITLYSIAIAVYSQNTVGLLDFEKDKLSPGYNLIYPNTQSSVFLLNNCGQIINEWTDDKNGQPGIMAELLEDGSILRASSNAEEINNTFGAGGSGGIIDIISWEDENLWHYVLADSIYRQHHEVKMMPNGNVLLIVWERHFLNEIVANGFDTISNTQRELWSDSVFEVNPENDSIVWQWNSWDHLIQDYDSTKLNFGIVDQQINRININYQEFSFGRNDFMHCNSIDFNEELDQLIISNRNYNEIWIIDHSISTEEAATAQGDLLFRWGNNAAYNSGDSASQLLFNQHNAHWIDDFVDTDSPYYGMVGVYNNSIDDGLSLGHVIQPVWNTVNQSYEFENNQYLPLGYDFEFSHPDTSRNFSTAASNIQFLKNGNVLMHAGRQGRTFELNPDGEVVWEYLVPMRNGFRVEQGELLTLSQNFTFQNKRYPLDFDAFENRELVPGDYLELNPNVDFCTILTSENNIKLDNINLYPNPSSAYLNIHVSRSADYRMVSMDGSEWVSGGLFEGINRIELSGLPSGLYFIVIDNRAFKFTVL